MRKKAIDRSKLNQKSKQYLADMDEKNKLSISGVSADANVEPIPRYIASSAENVISGENNTWIVMGRDRPGSRLSGYGGRGDTQAGSIDIVAGRLGAEAAKVNENDEQLWVDPDYKKDAARIYIAQKTDVDENFGVVNGSVGNSKTKSAVAVKADAVRVIAREGIKLVTGTDLKNSQGGEVRAVAGIDLIAGNDDEELQPIPKGDNLAEALDRMVHHMDKQVGIVDALLHTCMEMNQALTQHFHNSPYFGAPTAPSMIVMTKGAKVLINQLTKIKTSIVAHKKNLASFRLTYLNPAGAKYINSRSNNTN